MSEVDIKVPDVYELITGINDNLNQNPEDWRTRRDLVLQLGEIGRGLARGSQQEVLRALMERGNDDDHDEVRRSAREAVKLIWEAGWKTRQQATLEKVLKALNDEGSDELVRLEAANWIRFRAADISQDDRMVGEVLDALIERANIDKDPRVKVIAWDASREIWEVGWNARDNQETHQLAVFNRFLKVLREEEEDRDDWEVRKAAVDWLMEKAGDIAKNDRMVISAIDTLIERSKEEEKEDVQKSACQAIRKIWEEGWGNEDDEIKRQAVLDQVLKALNTEDINGDYKKVRETAAEWLGEKAGDIAKSSRMVGKALDNLTDKANKKDEDREVRRNGRDASRKIWNGGWEHRANRETILNHVLEALDEEEDDEEDKEFRQAAAEWVGEKADDIAGNDRMVGEALKALIERANKDQDEYTRRSAEASIRKIWDKGWKSTDNRETQQLIIIDQVLKALRSEGKNGSQANKAAIDWMWENAEEIAKDDRMIYEVLDTLINKINKVDDAVRPKAMDAIRKIWDQAWQPKDNHELSHQAVLDLVLKALKKEDTDGDYKKVREAAAEWLGEKAKGIAEDDRMVTDSLNVLFKRVKEEEKPNVRRSAREASRKIWDAGWEAFDLPKRTMDVKRQIQGVGLETRESERLAVLNQVLKALEKSDDWEFEQSAINWLGDKSGDLAKNYDMAEKVANTLAAIRKDDSQKDDLRESAYRSLIALWDALIKQFPLEDIKKKFLRGNENEKINTIRKLANENTLGSREAVNFLINKWVEWILREDEQRLVEITAEKVRYNEHAVLPLVEQFVKSWFEPQRESHRGLKISLQGKTSGAGTADGDIDEKNRLRVRRRVTRQLADMSDPRFFDQNQSILYGSILQELRDHAIPALVRRMPEEKDVEILENMARALLYTQEREGIDALAKEVVGEERTRKARQELLATYYLEPSKARSDLAADILKKAIQESKQTLRILQILNITVVVVGLSVLFYGLFFSIMGQDSASRIFGGLAAVGGLTGVIYQLIRDPLNRIQNANSNLVQMETAFTSFIWELNLNGTFIQSSYVNKGELSKKEIDDTHKRIERAMKSTMSLVAIFAKEGKQRLVTRLNKLEPAAGKSGNTEITIHGQYLKGDSRQKKESVSLVSNNQMTKSTLLAATNQKKQPLGMVAINHLPIDGNEISSWEEDMVRFKLPENLHGDPLGETVWISLFVDGMETNSLPFHVVHESRVGEEEKMPSR